MRNGEVFVLIPNLGDLEGIGRACSLRRRRKLILHCFSFRPRVLQGTVKLKQSRCAVHDVHRVSDIRRFRKLSRTRCVLSFCGHWVSCKLVRVFLCLPCRGCQVHQPSLHERTKLSHGTPRRMQQSRRSTEDTLPRVSGPCSGHVTKSPQTVCFQDYRSGAPVSPKQPFLAF